MGLRRVQARRPRVDGAQRAEHGAVRQHNRHRDVALKAVFRRRVMPAIGGILGHVIDNDGLMALPDLVADGGFDVEFRAGRQAERDLVAHRAADPALFGDAKPRPVDRHTTSRIRGTAAIPCTAAMSALRSVVIIGP
jgi:hypothetical protein